MKRISIVLLLATFSLLETYGQNAEEIHSFAKVYKPHEYYVEQAGLWWEETENDKSNERAWYNYFKANRMAKGTYNNAAGFDPNLNKGWRSEASWLMEGKDIIALTDKYIPGTFTNHYIKWWNDGAIPENFEHLKHAWEIDPTHPEVYDGFVVYYESQGNREKRKEYNQQWFRLNDLSSGFLSYCYNLIIGLEQGAILLTVGDNDTFPIWMLQDVFGIRTDVTVFNLSLLSIDTYREAMFREAGIPPLNISAAEGATAGTQKEIAAHIIDNKPENTPLYVSITRWGQVKDYEDRLYLTGLALKYSNENIDNVALLKNNFENRYALDYLENHFVYDISAALVDRMNVNYLPGMIKLYEHYTLSGETDKALRMKHLGTTIAARGGDEWKAQADELFR